VPLGLKEAIETPLQTFEGQGAKAIGTRQFMAAGEHPKGLRPSGEEEVDGVIRLHGAPCLSF